jgi:hypothetical protein
LKIQRLEIAQEKRNFQRQRLGQKIYRQSPWQLPSERLEIVLSVRNCWQQKKVV